mmetsp:Transcript_4336/g.11378  ORF Transcript_4336/g.11378 Transcript_4336/m.11378 type:complete len:217 (-) Transcript_4336:435-1085(-)
MARMWECTYICMVPPAPPRLQSVLEDGNENKGGVYQGDGVGHQIPLVPHAAPNLEQPRRGCGGPTDRQQTEYPPQRLQLDQVHDDDLDERQNVDGNEGVSQYARDRPERHGFRRRHEVDDERHAETAEEAEAVDVPELQLACEAHFETQQDRKRQWTGHVSVLGDGGRVNLMTSELFEWDDHRLGLFHDVRNEDAQLLQQRRFVPKVLHRRRPAGL